MVSCRIETRGLAQGRHRFRFEVDGAFFEAYESEVISDAGLEVEADIERSSAGMALELGIEGTVTVRCDRCLADLVIPVKEHVHFAISGNDDAVEGADDILCPDSRDGSVDLDQVIYDYVNLALPIRKVHPDGGCDPKMMELMKDILK